MKRILAINGSPRRSGNSSLLLKEFLKGAGETGAAIEEIFAHDLGIEACRGCLRCNLVKRCTLRDPEWDDLSRLILDADCLVVSSPIYFHHLPAPLKQIIDRFRSFVHVKIGDTGLTHTPWQRWSKTFVLILTMGSPSTREAMPVCRLFDFLTTSLGPRNQLKKILGTRLVVKKQVQMSADELLDLYRKINLPETMASADFERNKKLLNRCYKMGIRLGGGGTESRSDSR